MHGPTREQSCRHGRPQADVATRANRHLAGSTIQGDAWARDVPWLAVLLDAADPSGGCS
jgi:hypothetical protein